MNKGLVMLLEQKSDQVARTLHIGIEHDKKTETEKVTLLCRLAYRPVTKSPTLGPEIAEGLRIFLGEGTA